MNTRSLRPLTSANRVGGLRLTEGPIPMATRRFRVEQTDEGSVLVDRENAEHTVEVRRTLVHLTIEARVLRVCRSLVPGGLERWLTLDIAEISIGGEGDTSALSLWSEDGHRRSEAEDRIFGIEGDNLWDLEVTHARIVNLESRDRYDHPYVDRTVDSSGDHEEEAQGPVADLWYHTGDDAGYRSWSALVLTVGVPEPQFSELVDVCESGRADTVVLGCSCRAGTTGWAAFQSPRDLVLSSGESVRLQIDEASVSTPVMAPTPGSSASEKRSDRGEGSVDDESDRELNEKPPGETASVRRGLVVLAATVTVSLLSALVGASAIVALTIAILGGTAALITTLGSIGSAHIQRLTLLSLMGAQRGPHSGSEGPQPGAG